ncbi:MAG: hypothetical protein Q7S96_03065 [bacterium]|nr:hypothetical protein [bacterium]
MQFLRTWCARTIALVFMTSVIGSAEAKEPRERTFVVPVIANGAIAGATAEELSSILLVTAHLEGQLGDIVSITDAERLLGFSPVVAVQGCAMDILCLAQIGSTLRVQSIVMVSIDRLEVTVFQATLFRVRVASSTVSDRATFEVSGGAGVLTREFKRQAEQFFRTMRTQGADASDEHIVPAVEDLPSPPNNAVMTVPPSRQDDPPPATDVDHSDPSRAPLTPPFRDFDVPEKPSYGLVIAEWSGVALGLAGIGLGAWQGWETVSAQEGFSIAATQLEAVAAKEQGEAAGVRANILLGVGASVAITAIVLLIMEDEDTGGAAP